MDKGSWAETDISKYRNTRKKDFRKGPETVTLRRSTEEGVGPEACEKKLLVRITGLQGERAEKNGVRPLRRPKKEKRGGRERNIFVTPGD